MPVYKAPIRDIEFIFNEVLNAQESYQQLPCGDEATPDMVSAILQESAKFAEQELAPLYQSADKQGCKLVDGKVITPAGFKEAYQKYVEGGWQGLSHPVAYGGQGLPLSLGLIKSEMIGTANWAWGMYPGLSLGAMNTLYTWGSEEQKMLYMPKLCQGSWTGTMCLTESQCGSDLGQIKTRAEPNEDGSYTITGTKIFISAGDHDLAENIVHIVLARKTGAPAGTKGISLFIIPKYLPDENAAVGEFNHVNCGALEEKMGIHGSSTCVLNFDGAKGWMLGPENKGVSAMFTFMNTARIGTAVQGVAAAELSYQGALPYARERTSMRALSGVKSPDKPGDEIINHPDVRRMLLTQKAVAEGGRAMIYDTVLIADYMAYGATDEIKADAEEKLGFATPILKAFLTELGCESANLGMQVFGGHGYIQEWGMEQIVRDTRIATLYEGTTGIQALDLLGRKVILNKGKELWRFSKRIYAFCAANTVFSKKSHRFKMQKFVLPLIKYSLQWKWLTLRILLRAIRNRDSIGAASYDFLMFSGYITMGYFWARMADTAYQKLAQGSSERDFYLAKIQTAEFYFERMLPRAKSHASSMMGSLGSLMDMSEEQFAPQ